MTPGDLDAQWIPLVGYPGVYEITSAGSIRSVDRIGEYRHRRIRGRPLRVQRDRAGYCYVQLNHGGEYRTAFVHRLVAATFIGQATEGMQVNHRNGVKADNRVENLEYATASQNSLHRCRVLGHGRGDTNGKRKLRSGLIPAIRIMARDGDRLCDVARLLGVSRAAIANVVSGRTWAHIPDERAKVRA